MDLTKFDIIIINTSGGKDSQVSLHVVHEMAVAQGVSDRLVAVHADLGRMEWEGTRELAQTQAERYGVRFEAVARSQDDLLTHIRKRGMWPSSNERYCTSDHKRGPCGTVVTALTDEAIIARHGSLMSWQKFKKAGHAKIQVLNVFGFRAEESPARAKVPVFQENKRLSNSKRLVHDWLPIHEMTETEVWGSIKASGVPHHRAYDLGMPRLSCIFCVFAPKPALVLAGHHNRELLAEYVTAEAEMNHTFRKDLTLASIQIAVENGDGENAVSMNGAWNM